MSGVVAKIKLGDRDRVGSIEEANRLSALLDSRNGAEDDAFAVLLDAIARIVWRESFAWGDETAIGLPELIDDRRYAAIMHVARDIKVELG